MRRSRRRSSVGRSVALLFALALGGCGDATIPVVCLDYAASAVSVFVQDSVTSVWVASGATLVVQEGAFIDSISAPANRADLNAIPLSTPGTYERPGTYRVTVRRSGYADWMKAGVVVRAGECHVQGVVLTARLLTSS